MNDNWLTEPLARIHAMEDRAESIALEIGDKFLRDDGTPNLLAEIEGCWTLGCAVYETGTDALRALFGDDIDDMDETSLAVAYKARADVRAVVDPLVERILDEQINKAVAA